MSKLVARRVAAHASRQQERTDRITAALLADPLESNSSLIRRLGYGWPAVATVRADLEAAETIPQRDGRPQKRPGDRYPPMRVAAYTAELDSRVTGQALSRAQRASGRSAAARSQEEQLRELWPTDLTVPQIADRIGTTIDNVKKMRQRLGLQPRPRGRRRSPE